MQRRPVTRSQTRSNPVENSTSNKRQRSDIQNLVVAVEEERDDILQGLTFTKNGKHVVVDEKLLARLMPEPEPVIRSNPFENCPKFMETIKNGKNLTLEFLSECSSHHKMEPNSVKMAEMIGNIPIDWLALKNSTMLKDNWDYSVKVSGTPKATDQANSGRCWKFAYLNCLRYSLMKKLNVEHKFEFSETYLFFYDKVERANLFLEYMWTFRDRDLQDREVRMFTNPGGHFLTDGGCYNFVVSLVEKYGLVPKNVYTECLNSQVTVYMNEILVRVLNHMALEIFRHKDVWDREYFDCVKETYMKTIYDLVVKFLGEPPKPDEVFTWTFKDDHGETHVMKNMTAEKFYRIMVPHEDTKIVIINDPRHPETYYMPSFSEYSTNMIDGKPAVRINLPMDVFKNVVCESLKNDTPVWMACDMGKCFDQEANTSDVNRFNYENILGLDVEYDKGDMLDMLTSTPCHAMLFNGVDTIEDSEGEVVGYNKWRVENSWGMLDGDSENSPDHGFHRMSDSYVDKYVYEAVVDLIYFPPDIAEKFTENVKSGNSFTYSAFDAFGCVARKKCLHCNKNKNLKRPMFKK